MSKSYIYPQFLKKTLSEMSEISLEDFKKVTAYIEKTLFKPDLKTESSLEERDEKFSKESGINLRAIQWTGAAYINLMKTFMQESSEENFLENLNSLGLNKEHAKVLWDSLTENKEELPDTLPSDEKLLSIMPVLSEIAWRVADVKVNNGHNFNKSLVGIVGLEVLDTDRPTTIRFEVDEMTLDYLVEELTRMRTEMRKRNLIQGKN